MVLGSFYILAEGRREHNLGPHIGWLINQHWYGMVLSLFRVCSGFGRLAASPFEAGDGQRKGLKRSAADLQLMP